MAKMTHHDKPIINLQRFCFFSTTKLCILLLVSNSTSFWYSEKNIGNFSLTRCHPSSCTFDCLRTYCKASTSTWDTSHAYGSGDQWPSIERIKCTELAWNWNHLFRRPHDMCRDAWGFCTHLPQIPANVSRACIFINFGLGTVIFSAKKNLYRMARTYELHH
jgi:hypothetical protein